MAPEHHIDDAIETAPPVDASYGHAHETDDEQKPVLSNGGEGPTQRRLKGYHITWIGLCGGIGTGLFIGAGSAYATSGPAGLLLAYLVVGAVLWAVMQSISELATLLPTAGSFPHWATRFIDPAVGFSLAISYGYCYTISIAAECSASAVLVSYWTDITPAVVITISLVLILWINLMDVRFFGEAEVVTGAIKVLCFCGLVVVAIVISAGGGPKGDAIGFRYWNDPGAWVDYNGITGSSGHFLGFLSAFVNASFSFIGVETVVITAAEAINPHREIPKAANRVTYRIGFFYILGAFLIGIIVDPRNEGLVSGSGNAKSSPWVIAIQAAGIKVLPSIINACILISAWSAGNSYCWVGSRMILAMTTDRQLPQFFGRTTKKGVPYVAVITSWLFGPLAYLSLGSGGASQAFDWLLNLSTVAGLIAWATLCFSYIRFYRALKVQGVDRESLPWKAPWQPYTAWFGAIGSVIITLLCGFPVFLKGNWNTADFIASYIGIPIFIVPIIGWKLAYGTKFARAKDIDVWSGRLSPEEAARLSGKNAV
ncbi:putative general amino acid permease [Fusarium longipes]|uniref:Putative general amino acid permease n=1 Tax=Fusarium longipes TaxID=694270 RepID=A0A395T1A8_9HYPO|nr:putative general amino acid permease [Fusarium longipes]